jgi:hypothetical protein
MAKKNRSSSNNVQKILSLAVRAGAEAAKDRNDDRPWNELANGLWLALDQLKGLDDAKLLATEIRGMAGFAVVVKTETPAVVPAGGKKAA